MNTVNELSGVLDDHKVKDQISGAVIDSINRSRIADELFKLGIQDANFKAAVSEIDKVREFIGSPEHILGNPNTKHGEIAEQVEVGIRRAKDALNGKQMSATFEGVPRTDAADYLINGIKVQSKFINGISKNLDHVLKHMEQYPGFGKDDTYYHIPRDTHHIITKLINNESVEGLSEKTVKSITERVKLIESQSGKSFTDVVRPGLSEYAEVQQGTVHKTLDGHEEKIKSENNDSKDKIRNEHKPSQGEAVKAGLAAGAVGASVSIVAELYKKSKEGKKFYKKGDFTSKDWKDVGITGLKGGAIGTVSGYAIYMLTNYASLSAPLAGAIVSASKSVGELAIRYKKGEIQSDELFELGMVVTAESAIVGLSTAIGQLAIPIPILGSVIGSIAGSLLVNIISKDQVETARAIRKELDDYLVNLDAAFQSVIDSITNEFSSLTQLTRYAFDFDRNCNLLQASVDLAISYGVPEEMIMRNPVDVDKYILT
ncbi:MAG: hypothetical protein PHX79_05375 [Sphaerochaetaceae bacterium]|nr:hypothetical protein [Sphaerochaetaceae bacterium]